MSDDGSIDSLDAILDGPDDDPWAETETPQTEAEMPADDLWAATDDIVAEVADAMTASGAQSKTEEASPIQGEDAWADTLPEDPFAVFTEEDGDTADKNVVTNGNNGEVLSQLQAGVIRKDLSSYKPKELRKYFKQLFSIGDQDGNGSLDRDEIRRLLDHSDFPFDMGSVDQVLQTAGTGVIYFDEFVVMMSKQCQRAEASTSADTTEAEASILRGTVEKLQGEVAALNEVVAVFTAEQRKAEETRVALEARSLEAEEHGARLSEALKQRVEQHEASTSAVGEMEGQLGEMAKTQAAARQVVEDAYEEELVALRCVSFMTTILTTHTHTHTCSNIRIPTHTLNPPNPQL